MLSSIRTRRAFLQTLLTAAITGVGSTSLASAPLPIVEVWKSPTCGCCNDWIKHLQTNGFQVRAIDKGNNAIRKELGMPAKYGSCHTAKIDGYVIEGHVPAKEIKRLLKERPTALGLSVPEMPIGTPGMDGPEYGGQLDPYNVLLIRKDGSASVYQAYKDTRPPKK